VLTFRGFWSVGHGEKRADTERIARSRQREAQECDVVLKAHWNQVNLKNKEAEWTQQPVATADARSSRADQRMINIAVKSRERR